MSGRRVKPQPPLDATRLACGVDHLVLTIDTNRTPVSKTRPLSPYKLTHEKVMMTWTSDIHAAARQEPTGGPVFILNTVQHLVFIIYLYIYSTNKRLLLLYSYIYLIPYYVHNLSMHLVYQIP